MKIDGTSGDPGHICWKGLYSSTWKPSEDKPCHFLKVLPQTDFLAIFLLLCWCFAAGSAAAGLNPCCCVNPPALCPSRAERWTPGCVVLRLDVWLLSLCRIAPGSVSSDTEVADCGLFSRSTYHLHTNAAWGVRGWWTALVALSLKHRIFNAPLLH